MMCCYFCCIWRGHILNSGFCSGCFRAMVQLFYDIIKVLHDGFSVGSMINCWDWPDEGSRPPGWNRDLLQKCGVTDEDEKYYHIDWPWMQRSHLGFSVNALRLQAITSDQREASWVTEIKIFPLDYPMDMCLFHCSWHGSYNFHFNFVQTECFPDTRLWNRLWADLFPWKHTCQGTMANRFEHTCAVFVDL